MLESDQKIFQKFDTWYKLLICNCAHIDTSVMHGGRDR